MRIGLLAMGPVPDELLVGVADALSEYGIVCETVPERPLPDGAYDPDRGQYDARAVVDNLEASGDRVLAVTAEDLYADGLNFVFGLATIGGSRAVVSYHRLRSPDERLLLERVVKECVHELGHSIGLTHCATPGCVMTFSNSLDEADLKGRRFCETCRTSLSLAGLASPG